MLEDIGGAQLGRWVLTVLAFLESEAFAEYFPKFSSLADNAVDYFPLVGNVAALFKNLGSLDAFISGIAAKGESFDSARCSEHVDSMLDKFRSSLSVCERQLSCLKPMLMNSGSGPGEGVELTSVQAEPQAAGAAVDPQQVVPPAPQGPKADINTGRLVLGKSLLSKFIKIGTYAETVVGPAMEETFATMLRGYCKELSSSRWGFGWVVQVGRPKSLGMVGRGWRRARFVVDGVSDTWPGVGAAFGRARTEARG